MLKITMEVDNKFAASCSPMEFMYKYIFKDGIWWEAINNKKAIYETNSAHITIKKIEQI